MKKLRYLYLISLAILISLFSFSIQKNYDKSNLKKFLRNLGVPDVPFSQFLEEPDSSSDNDINPGEEEDGQQNPEEDEDGQNPGEDENDQLNPEEEEENEQLNTEEEEDGKQNPEEEHEEEQQEEDQEEKKKEGDQEENEENTFVNIKCLWVDKYNVYTLQKLQKKEDYEKDIKEGTVIFNFCQDTRTNKSLKSTVLWKRNNTNNDSTELIRAAGSIDGEKKNKNKWIEIDDDEEEKGLKIILAHGDQCKKDEYHQTNLKIYCDETIPDNDFLEYVDLDKFYDKKNPCNHTITARSIYGCPLNDWYLLRRIMKKYKYLFGLGFMLIGVFLCMWGNKYKIPTIMVVLGLIFSYIISIIVLNFIPSLINTEKKLWILLGIGFLIGSFVGYLIKAKITRFTKILGISMGYSVAEVIYLFIQGFIEWNPTYLYYSVIVVCCIGGIVVGYYLIKTVMILGTSLVGGYIFMRGVAVIFGNYINEEEFVDLIKNGEYEQIRDMKNGWVYLYVGIWLAMTVFGFFYQCI